jgi:hypothetical protein
MAKWITECELRKLLARHKAITKETSPEEIAEIDKQMKLAHNQYIVNNNQGPSLWSCILEWLK